MSPRSDTFEALRSELADYPVIDTHEHTAGPEHYPRCDEPIAALIQGYVRSDLVSAGGEADVEMLADCSVATRKKWPIFRKLWARTEHTGYAHVTKWILKHEYGVEKLTLKALESIKPKLADLSDPKGYDAYLDKHNIKCRLVDLVMFPQIRRDFLAGKHKLPPRDRLMISLPELHSIRSFEQINEITQRSGRNVTCLDEYLEVLGEQLDRYLKLAAAGAKDQSAYNRGIAYDNPPKAQADELFNRIIADPRASLGWPEAKPLDDFIFGALMRLARDRQIPIQLHTGHMAGIRNDIAKTRAVLLTKILELHRDVNFDLFHGNWPYAGDWLYLGKNYPNVHLDCCWLHIIDPRYARRVLADSLVTVPHSKIHGFGGDYLDSIMHAAGHLAIAKDNIAAALAEMVDSGWMDAAQARQVAADWLFNNPNEFFKLGFKPISV